MADYDLKSDARSYIHIAPDSYDADVTGTTVDTLGFGSLTFGIYVGAGGITFTGTNRIDVKVQYSDDDSTWAVVPDDFLILDPGATAPGDTGIVRSLIAAHASADTVLTTVGYRGKKRYARVLADFGGTHASPTPLAVFATLGHVKSKPVGASSIEV